MMKQMGVATSGDDFRRVVGMWVELIAVTGVDTVSAMTGTKADAQTDTQRQS